MLFVVFYYKSNTCSDGNRKEKHPETTTLTRRHAFLFSISEVIHRNVLSPGNLQHKQLPCCCNCLKASFIVCVTREGV